MHLLGEYSEMIRFWATLTQFWSSSGQKMAKNESKCWFAIIISKSIHPIQLKFVVYRIDLLGHIGQILAL